MFAHYPYIAKQHYVALESAIRNHSVISSINASLLAKMYKLALDGLTTGVKEDGFFTSSLAVDARLTGVAMTVSSVTDAKSGLWIQLAKVEGQAQAYLTLGQKWAMEQLVPAHGNVSTIFWK
jgi:phage gp16-like protein